MCAGPWPDRNWKLSVEQAEFIMLNDAFIESLRLKLESHPIYAAVQTLDDLRVFMQHHVYSVWDFMSFIKYPQNEVATALGSSLPPAPSAAFTRTTFDVLASGKPHRVAAALALGREHVIPSMFRAFLSRMVVTQAQAPSFHYYLNRHVHLDEDFHAPLSLRLPAALCGGDAGKWREAEAAAETAVNAHMLFWDGVQKALHSQHAQAA